MRTSLERALPTLQEIEAEQRRRKLSRFLPWARPEMRWDWPHIQFIAGYIQKVADGEIQNLMISVPPQHGKTEIASVSTTAWLLYRNPSIRLALATYNQDHANKISRAARRVAEPLITVASDRNAVQEWETLQGGRVKAVGFGSGLSGYPVDVGIIDDPYKDRAEAESELIRERRWEWYTDVWLARNPQSQIFIGTEWHEDGLHNRIMGSAQGDRWTRIKLPAIAEIDDPLGRSEGEALCPERVSIEELVSRRAMSPHSFEAMYQQNPTPREGAMFHVLQLGFCEANECPANMPKVRRWDIASSAGGGDHTVGALLSGPDSRGRYYVLDVVRGQWSSSERDLIIRKTAERDGLDVKQIVPQDPGAGGKSMAEAHVRLLAGYPVSVERESGSKITRADPFSSQVNAGNVVIVRGAWNGEFVEELRSFPMGKHDDQVDAASGAFNSICTVVTSDISWPGY